MGMRPSLYHLSRVPTQNGKNEMELISSPGILNRLGKSGKITQITGKVRTFQTNVIYLYYVLVTFSFNY